MGKRKYVLWRGICAALTLMLFLTGCDASSDTVPLERTRTVFAMDTVMELKVYGGSEALMDTAASRINDLEAMLSVTRDDSEIRTLNTTGSADLSQETYALLTEALALCESTGGALDISIYPVMKAWGFTTKDYRIPEEEELRTLLQNVDHRLLTLEGSRASVPDGVQIDLGAVAKGYTGDILCGLLREAGVTSALLTLGGNIQALGTKPDGSAWRVAVQHPVDAGYLGVLELEDMAAITSGGYERYFIGDDGETYWHIIDPDTGRPAERGLLSVTIVGERGVVCDAMSTALFVMGLEASIEYWRSGAQSFEAIWVTDNGEVYLTQGLCDRFTLSVEYEDLELKVVEP